MSGESAAEAELIACREKIEEHERQLRVLRAQLAQLQSGKRAYRSDWADYSANKKNFDRKKVATMARKGVPSELRKDVWVTWSRMHHYHQPGVLRQLSGSGDLAFMRPIEQDIGRTLSDHGMFSSPSASGIAPLRRILRSYSQRNPQIGYCQGMSLLAGCLLLILDEDDAYWMFCTLLENYLPHDYFTPGMAGIMADQEVLKALVADYLPQLHAHFVAIQFDISMVGIGWFMTLFVDSCPLQTALRIWDIVFCEGDKILFCFAMAILHHYSEELLLLTNAGQLSMTLKQICSNLYYPDDVLFTAFKMMRTLKRDAVADLRRQKHSLSR